jgi:hypothetical protein
VTLNYVRYAPSLLLCAAIFSAGLVQAGEPLPQITTQVTAVVLPDGRVSKVALREMGREASHILKQSGVSLRWQLGVPARSVSGMLVVVKLRGNCEMDGSPAFLVPGPLGWSHESDGTVLPFSDLACDNLRGAVVSARGEGNPFGGNILLGRAMGRVLAHELYHIVADTSVHGHDGVAQAALTARELTSGQMELAAPEVAAVQNELGRAR